jgi:predicted Zn finger-like uncharacterized protein
VRSGTTLGFLDMGAGIGDLGRKARASGIVVMILTCPECATRYVAPDGSIGPAGRVVRCANCNASWRAMPDPEDEPLELAPVAEPPEEAPSAPPEPPAEPAPERAELTGDDLPKAYRRRVKARKENRKAAASGAVFGLAAAALVGMLISLAVLREGVVRAWPKTASAYALLGMPVNATGLEIEHRPTFEFVDGRPAVVVRGSLRNVENREVTVPPLKITLLDVDGKPLRTKLSQGRDLRVPAGATRYFEESVLDPPRAVSDVEVSFAIGAAANARRQAPAAEGAKPAAGETPSLRPSE